MALTDTAVRKAKPGERVVGLSDGGGLQLWVTPTGEALASRLQVCWTAKETGYRIV